MPPFVLFTSRPPSGSSRARASSTASSWSPTGASRSRRCGRIEAVLPDGSRWSPARTLTEESQDAMREGLVFFNSFHAGVRGRRPARRRVHDLQHLLITVAQRTRENALLRAIGASRRQVLASVLVEAFVVGLVASLVGLAAGVAVARGSRRSSPPSASRSPPADRSVPPAPWSRFSSACSSLVAPRSRPARKAGKVPPVAAMRDVAVGSTGYGSKERVLVGVGAAGLGVAAFSPACSAPSTAPCIVGPGALLVFFGVSVLGRTIALPLSRVLGSPLPHLCGIAGELARENAMRNPKRTAATASALMIGVGLVGFITIFAASTKASLSEPSRTRSPPTSS